MTDFTWLSAPVDARALFAPERAALLDVLRALGPGDWEREAVPGWSVRDVAAHVLGDDYGRLARDRDGDSAGPAPRPGESLEAFIHRANQEWVDAARRISPSALVETLEVTGRGVAELWQSGTPDEPGLGVSWAGADPAPRWLDCARDLSEYWTHRQQIRHATGQPTDADPRLLGPVLDTFLRALPFTLRTVSAEPGTRARVVVRGAAGGAWTATAMERGWVLTTADQEAPGGPDPAAVVRLDPETAWLLCTRGITPEEALGRPETKAEGDERLVAAMSRILSIIR
ncbi:maleylpyruvate isomerase family mycothiol-dependent enzyme [Streptomyces iconiensis]|uniref:Maleylpyruvate isomerase family mycothiol-dependent enzyme n=1 Tax=Streptomyces iconiensis TaxID=1384038 RepID=A0ABT6ZWJ0_9ACTN|nr:maleylpyruvate isomerase family mycothiol-dependent enzyme [Streptomyces iconiensis]MDJ1133435.1 maleylpyruvate isomerase family mycothiol-dependent enzyme [Streptomyces iconiensis]